MLGSCSECGKQVSTNAASCPHCGNVIREAAGPRWSPGAAAVLSFLLPGLGQMYKGQVFGGLLWFMLTAVGYVFLLIPGLVLHLCCIIGASMGDPYER